ncbi:hypothetical protein BDP81DRAFT_428344 [Colletotrichum phormii]|uniref:Uncharacterized protein n=1 Tax=Colletotrichum phormii TaxID=359342 RepID=A0AAI9ZRZ0_9PEZI|nr:uncharacterized protein BDP81DRAFT_428344 [Colletotrichum phormii]KAK1636786.1 hypothetical protein BDP81DRAFT_428344 [Colletotrichum phormii]
MRLEHAWAALSTLPCLGSIAAHHCAHLVTAHLHGFGVGSWKRLPTQTYLNVTLLTPSHGDISRSLPFLIVVGMI